MVYYSHPESSICQKRLEKSAIDKHKFKKYSFWMYQSAGVFTVGTTHVKGPLVPQECGL